MLLSINPLADNLAWVWDIIALIITFGVIQALVLVNSVLPHCTLFAGCFFQAAKAAAILPCLSHWHLSFSLRPLALVCGRMKRL
jgi:hypothetical protein